MKKLVRWTPEQKELFKQYAGKLPDEEVARLTGHTVLEVQYRRGSYRIPKPDPYKFPKAFRDYVRSNFRTMTNKDMSIALKEQFPTLDITENSVKSLMTNLHLHRTQEDFDYIREQLKSKGVWKRMILENGEYRLKDWAVLNLINRDAAIKLEKDCPTTKAIIEVMQSNYRLKRAIKQFKDDRKANGRPTYIKVEGASTKDG